VVVYSSQDREFAEPVLEAYEERAGVEVLPKFDVQSSGTVGMANAIIAEKSRPRCHLFGNNEILNTLRLEGRGLLAAFRPSHAGDLAETSKGDVDLSVRGRAIAGDVDRGDGSVWRAQQARNSYIARYNPLEGPTRVYKVEGGRRARLDHADAPGDQRWHTLRITMRGRAITGYLDGP